MSFFDPRCEKDGDSFTLTFRMEPVTWLLLTCVGLCLIGFGAPDMKGMGTLFVILGCVLGYNKARRVHFDASSRTLIVDKCWGMRRTTGNMKLLDHYYMKSVNKSGRYCVLVLKYIDGHEREIDFGPFSNDGKISEVIALLATALDNPVDEQKRAR